MGKGQPVKELIEGIARECREAGASQWDTTKIIKELSKIESSDLSELRDKAIELLEKLDPKAASVYSSFHRMKVFTSAQRLEPFDRGNIIKSLLRETNVTRSIAEKIGHDVEDKIKDLDIEFLNTALIRELTSVKLLEYNHERIHSQYTRIGMPVFDARQKIESMPWKCAEIMTEFNVMTVIPKNAVRMHFENEIFISGIQDFSSRPQAYSFSGESKNIFGLLGEIIDSQNYSTEPVALNALNFKAMEFYGSAKKASAEFSEAFNGALHEPVTLGLNLFTPEHSNADKNKAVRFANIFLKEFPEKCSAVISADSKFKLKLLDSDAWKKGFNVLNSRLGDLKPAGRLFTASNGILLETGINLALAAHKSGGKESSFFKELEEKASAISGLAKIKRNLLTQRKYLKEKGIEVSAMETAVSLYGIGNALNEFAESRQEKTRLAEKIVRAFKEEIGGKTIVSLLESHEGTARFSGRNSQLGIGEIKNETMLDSAYLSENLDFARKAGSRKQALELMDKNVKLVKAGLSSGNELGSSD